VKTVGVTFIGLTPTAGWQGRLFDDKGEGQPGAANRQRDLDRAVDALRERHGFGRILRGSSLSLLGTLPLGPDGFRLRTPSLNQ
jgi:hypothetical protein